MYFSTPVNVAFLNCSYGNTHTPSPTATVAGRKTRSEGTGGGEGVVEVEGGGEDSSATSSSKGLRVACFGRGLDDREKRDVE